MAQENHSGKFRKNETTAALLDILDRYIRIRPNEIESFTPVYYPIAMMEMRLQEQTFEDFETVQLTVLRMAALGITDPGIIARTLGLSTSYVGKVMRLLVGYGHLDGERVTELGIASLQQEKKITTSDTLQKFQMDALNGTLLKLGQVVTEGAISDLSDTQRIIGHLSHLDGISEDVLRSQLEGEKGKDYIYHSAGILHANVTAIRDVRCTQIRFAKSYMLQLAGQTLPIVFAKRYDRTKKDMAERFTWQPYSVANPDVIRLCGFSGDTPISTAHANEYILQLQTMLAEHQAKNPPDTQEILKAVNRVYDFDPAGLEIREVKNRTVVTIRHEAVTTLRKALFPLLRACCAKREQLHTSEYLYGRLISLRIDSPRLQLLGQLITDPNAATQKALTDKLWEQFRDYSGEEPLVDAMIQFLQKP